MNDIPNIDNTYLTDSEIDFNEILNVLWKGKWYIVASTTLFIIIAFTYSFSLPNIYKSKALLSPVGEQNSMNSAMKSYGGIASLAGINLPSQASGSNSVKALDKLKSLSFFTDNILPNIFLPDLMAIKSWDPRTNTIIYNKKDFNQDTQTWIRDFGYPQTQIPSAQESFRVFMSEKLNFSQNKDTGFITISIKHQSPYVAQAWTELVVKEINYFFRVKDKAEAQTSMIFLNNQMAKTSLAEIRQVIAQLLQQKTQKMTLIEASNFYVFDYIDPPAVMEQKAEPQRAIIVVLGAFLGSILGMFIVLIRRYYFVGKKL
tara:strand:- start:5352 stop:6299 length:948 start_codon:yes stop_codon:yes gene_type:complete